MSLPSLTISLKIRLSCMLSVKIWSRNCSKSFNFPLKEITMMSQSSSASPVMTPVRKLWNTFG